MNISILGTGYVGLTTGVCLAYLGHEVTCHDLDENKINALRRGIIPIHEPGLGELLSLARHSIRFTTEPAEGLPHAEVIFIAVGTPSLADGNPDLQYVGAAGKTIGKYLGERFTVIVNKSTVPIGCAHWVETVVRDSYQESHGCPPKDNFAVASNPEFLREGSAIHDTLYPDRVVLGSDDARALGVLHDLYQPVIEQSFPAPNFLPRPEGISAVPAVTANLTSSEMTKYAANAFLAMKISYANELAQLSERVGADISQVVRGMGLDSRIGHRFLQAGLGWGGSCFGKDTAALVTTAREYGIEMRLVQSARDVNYGQRQWVIEKLLRELKILKGKTIGLLGLAFKPNTDDLRDAPALDIAARLIERGAKVRAHDPVALDRARREYGGSGIQFCNAAEDVAADAHALILVTEWPQYQSLCWNDLASRMRVRLIVDGRNCLDREKVEQAGFRYLGMGS
ncbi:MAG TPA: UDP-glucose/GDP-mannose dehydrogenase family protein [Bryobacteraceae bacterium]|nr:UDP-glucose/GDP-mannose dehydrogenase family protein [Bryobacteraceae bacterium]